MTKNTDDCRKMQFNASGHAEIVIACEHVNKKRSMKPLVCPSIRGDVAFLIMILIIIIIIMKMILVMIMMKMMLMMMTIIIIIIIIMITTKTMMMTIMTAKTRVLCHMMTEWSPHFVEARRSLVAWVRQTLVSFFLAVYAFVASRALTSVGVFRVDALSPILTRGRCTSVYL